MRKRSSGDKCSNIGLDMQWSLESTHSTSENRSMSHILNLVASAAHSVTSVWMRTCNPWNLKSVIFELNFIDEFPEKIYNFNSGFLSIFENGFVILFIYSLYHVCPWKRNYLLKFRTLSVLNFTLLLLFIYHIQCENILAFILSRHAIPQRDEAVIECAHNHIANHVHSNWTLFLNTEDCSNISTATNKFR